MPRRWTFVFHVFLDRVSVNSQLPLNGPKRLPLAPSFLNRLPSLLLKERRLPHSGGGGLAGSGSTLCGGGWVLLEFRTRVRWLESRCPALAQTVGAGGRDRNSCRTAVAVSEKCRTGRSLLGGNDASVAAHVQPAVQSLQDLNHGSGVAGAFSTRQQLQGMQLESHRVVLGHSPAVLEAQDVVTVQTW